mmetsp:Transcript_39206/g.83480  ORF Transcript_39206/g.83480 Transcript_39206/m.83480 type:complete len:204 (+) Transcript_39206:459-1070(+)
MIELGVLDHGENSEFAVTDARHLAIATQSLVPIREELLTIFDAGEQGRSTTLVAWPSTDQILLEVADRCRGRHDCGAEIFRDVDAAADVRLLDEDDGRPTASHGDDAAEHACSSRLTVIKRHRRAINHALFVSGAAAEGGHGQIGRESVVIDVDEGSGLQRAGHAAAKATAWGRREGVELGRAEDLRSLGLDERGITEAHLAG